MDELGLYVHIPFCMSKCFYCDFPSFSKKDGMMHDYVAALIKEGKKYKDYNFNTVFIGGGTPSYLSENSLKELSNLFKIINLTDHVEFTMEVNPGTLNEEKMKIIKEMGINRISFGLQSSNDATLKKLGRIHSFDDFKRSFEIARKHDIKNINVDLIYGIPGDSIEISIKSINDIVEFCPEHISAYNLILEENTVFMDLVNEGKLLLKDEDIEIKEQEKIYEALNNSNYIRYEISNFSKENCRCKHNLKYWNLEEYIGIGSSSHSYVNGNRFNNVASIEEYINKINKEGSAIENLHFNSLKENIEEFMILGLRKIEGINLHDFENKFNKSFFEIYEKVFLNWEKKKLIVQDKERIKLTKEGLDLSNIVLKDFLF